MTYTRYFFNTLTAFSRTFNSLDHKVSPIINFISSSSPRDAAKNSSNLSKVIVSQSSPSQLEATKNIFDEYPNIREDVEHKVDETVSVVDVSPEAENPIINEDMKHKAEEIVYAVNISPEAKR